MKKIKLFLSAVLGVVSAAVLSITLVNAEEDGSDDPFHMDVKAVIDVKSVNSFDVTWGRMTEGSAKVLSDSTEAEEFDNKVEIKNHSDADSVVLVTYKRGKRPLLSWRGEVKDDMAAMDSAVNSSVNMPPKHVFCLTFSKRLFTFGTKPGDTGAVKTVII